MNDIPPIRRRQLLSLSVGLLWLVAVVAGLGSVLSYEATQGTAEQAPPSWPRDTELSLNDRGATLVMFAHPRCPCTRASLGELDKTIARCQDNVKACVVFLKPTGASGDWDQTDLWKAARAIPGVQVLQDRDGKEAQRFHATTSGQTLLYNRESALVFNGGITMARGHFGDNPGRDSIESYLTTGSPVRNQTPVYGCPIVKNPN